MPGEKTGTGQHKKAIHTKAVIQASSSNGRAPDSKSGCWGFESLLACHFFCGKRKLTVSYPKLKA